ncbi:MAG: 3-isopropylmalate dehydratase large subunit [Syntrophales bacterium]|jgi:3-isopropylmalate/(R)-2-methylmalate dehydratase large subunit|nr:3-isopropylmalate dehydratase large subunit [Syntrophales bacterium]MDY0044105.1 3-isopropylmalate dehydratase large subunit [Syntrophales bacterium]
MAMTITEKILAQHANLDRVAPGDLIEVKVDRTLANDITAPIAIKVFKQIGVKEVFDKDKVTLVADHFVPNKDIDSAQQVKLMRDFAREQALTHYYEGGDSGIEHVILPEKGLVLPGHLVIGADSHTCTYGALGAFSTGVGSTDLGVIMATGEIWLKVPPTIRVEINGTRKPYVGGKDLILHLIGLIGVEGALYSSLEFAGETVDGLSMSQRLTMANMAIEAGGKNGIFEPDDATLSFVKERSLLNPVIFKSDNGAHYERVIKIDASRLEPQVAFPHSPANVRELSKVGTVAIDQAFIGSCTNGSLEDLQDAAEILKGRHVAPGVRLIVIPGSPLIYKQAIMKGLVEIFLDAGAVIGPPCCGPCLGGHMGILAAGERAIATTNRNFIGRMGHPQSEVYLSNPFVAAASAILGKIGGPDELKGK